MLPLRGILPLKAADIVGTPSCTPLPLLALTAVLLQLREFRLIPDLGIGPARVRGVDGRVDCRGKGVAPGGVFRAACFAQRLRDLPGLVGTPAA